MTMSDRDFPFPNPVLHLRLELPPLPFVPSTRPCPSRQQAQDILQQDLPIMYLYSPRVLFGMSAKLSGFVPVADGMIRITGMKLAK